MARYIKYPTRNYLDATAFEEPWGMCDHTGTMWPRSQLVRQMIQSGNSVTWNGLWVAQCYVDPLDYQKKVPPVKKDPTPVRYPRPNPDVKTVF